MQPSVTKPKFYRFATAVGIVFAAILFGYSYSIMRYGYKSSANYPGKEIANYVMQQWSHYYATKPIYVVGNRYIAGNIAYFTADKLLVKIVDRDLNTVTPDVSYKSGAIFVWFSGEQDLFKKFHKDFPQLVNQTSFTIHWKRNRYALPIEVNMAFLPPTDNR